MADVSQSSPLTPARQRAQALADSGDRLAAIVLLAHAVGLGRTNLGDDDPDVLAATHQLARAYLDVDDPVAARRVLEEAYAAGRWRLGDSDPLMLEISYDLGFVAEELGNRHEARKALTRVVAAGQPVLGDFHWAVVKARAYLDGNTDVLRPPPQPIQQPPVAHVPVEGTPVEGTPVEQAPVEGTPVYEAPAWPDPVQDVPVPAPGWPEPVGRMPAQHRPVVDELSVVHPVAHPRLPAHQPPSPPVHRPAEQRLDAAARQELRDPASGVEPPYPRRGSAVFAAIAAVLALIIAVAALVFVLADRGDEPERSDVPTLGGGPPPAEVRVDDFGTSVTISWSDPGQGKTSFIVTGGHPGEVLRSMGTVGPGQTRFTLQGLNDQLDYCFAVLAVYSTTDFASSPQSCTSRPDPGSTG